MANTIQIAVTLDEKGVVTGVQNIGKALDQLPAHTKPAFDGMSTGQLEARNALNELAYGFGIQLPGEISKSIAKIPLLASSLNALGEAAVFTALVAGIVEAGIHIDELSAKLYSLGRDETDFGQRILNTFKGNGFLAAGDIGKQIQQETVNGLLQPFVDQTNQIVQKSQQIGLEGASAIEANATAQISALKNAQNELLKATLQAHGGDESNATYLAVKEQLPGVVSSGESAIQNQEQKQLVALYRDTYKQIQQIQSQANEAGLTGLQLTLQKESDALGKLPEQFKGREFAIPDETAAIRKMTEAEVDAATQTWIDGTRQLEDQMAQQGLSGSNAINARIASQVVQQQEAFSKAWHNNPPFPDPKTPEQQQIENDWLLAAQELQDRLSSIYGAGDRERALLARQNADDVADANAKAAADSLPPWLQATATIQDDYSQTIRKINEDFQDSKINKDDVHALYGAALMQENADLVKNFQQTRDELAGQIGSIFDDITSGNLRQAVLGELKHLFSEILAQWLLTLNGMKSAGGGQGILGSILGGIFGGNKSSSGSSLLGDFGELVPSFAESGSIASVAPIAIAGSGLFSGLQSPFSLTGGTGLTSGLTSPFAAQASSIGLGLSAGAGTASAVNLQTANSLVGSTLEQSLAKFFPHGITVGGLKIGGPALAGLGAGVGLSSLLYGYQSGNPVLGGLGGVAGGALAGFSFGGPLGAVIGGAIGGIGGLLSGIFGGQKRHDEAETLIQGTLGPQIAAILQSYEKFSTDQQDAISQLNDLETQAKQQLDQLGQDKLYWSELVPQVNSATDQINQIQGVRDQRSALNFAPPEFAMGGTVPGFGPVPIIAHGGEEIVRQPYAGMFRSQLKAANIGAIPLTSERTSAPVVHSEPHFYVHAIDVNGVSDFFKKNGRHIREAIRTDMLRNWNGGNV